MDSTTRIQELDRLRTRSPVQYFTEDSSDDSGFERDPGPSSRGRKIRKVESNIPQIVHLTWLNKQCYGTIPRERFTNVISLAKQFKANGWHVKIWTNNPMILHRAGACLGAGADGQNRGLALESHFMEGKDSRGKGKIEICPHQELCGELAAVSEKAYRNAPSYLFLPDWDSMGSKYVSDDAGEVASSGESRESSPVQGRSISTKLERMKQKLSEPSSKPRAASPLSQLHKRIQPGIKKSQSAPGSPKGRILKHIKRPPSPSQFVGTIAQRIQQSESRRSYKKDLLDFYLSHQVGESNYSAASDLLRYTALQKYGGVYVDSDTQGRGFHDSYTIHIPAPYAPEEILMTTGWRSGISSDIIASEPAIKEIQFIQLDQLYHCTLLERLPYSVMCRHKDGLLKRMLVKKEQTGLVLRPGNHHQTAIKQSCTDTLSLADVARPKGYFYQKLPHVEPAVQQGLDVELGGNTVDENIRNPRFDLTLYSPGPRTLNRMQTVMHLCNADNILFKNIDVDDAEKTKRFDPATTLSITRWGRLSRINTLSWDKVTRGAHKKAYSFDDSEVEALCSSMRAKKVRIRIWAAS